MTGFQKIMIGIGLLFLVCIILCCGILTMGDNKSSTVPIEVVKESPNVVQNETVKTTKKIELKTYEFSNGNYISGQDFNPGVYDIIAIKGNGNVHSTNSFSGGINAIMGIKNDDFYQKEYKNINLPKDVTLEISNVTVSLIQKR